MGCYCRHLLFFSLKSVFVAACVAMEKNPALFSRAFCSKTCSGLEFGPLGFGSVAFVYTSRKEKLGLTLVLYSAKEFCLTVVYTMLSMLTSLLWLSDV